MKTFYWLIKREYWENRGSFLWAVVVSGAIIPVFTLLSIVVTLLMGGKPDIMINGKHLITSELTTHMPDTHLTRLGQGLDVIMLMPGLLIGSVFFICRFFYCLNCLADDRRDRSILFWKSLPLSDRDTVLSKLFCAMLLMPAIALLTSILAGLLTTAIVCISISLYGAPSWSALWASAHPIRLFGALLASFPLAAVWSLPSLAWLMFCSAAARSRPMLWAILVPVGAGVVLAWLRVLDLPIPYLDQFWSHGVLRALLGITPGDGWPHIENMSQLAHRTDIPNAILQSTADYGQLLTPPFIRKYSPPLINSGLQEPAMARGHL